MSDRELLELAARAAGYPISEGHIVGANNGLHWIYIASDEDECPPPTDSTWTERWNPLTDDGDALRLAATLGIDIEWRADGRVAAYRHANANGYCFTAFGSSREDRDANVRRAIVRAAAEIGKEME